MFKKIGKFLTTMAPWLGISFEIAGLGLMWYLLPELISLLNGGGLEGIIGSIFLIPIYIIIGVSTIGLVVSLSFKYIFTSKKWYLIVMQLLIIVAAIILTIYIFKKI